MKKSADSDSVSDSRRRHYKLIYTGRRAQRLSTGGQQMRRRCTSQEIVLGRRRRNATTGRHAVRPQQCRGHNHLGRSPERPGHAPFNSALSILHPDHSTTFSLRRHLTSSTASSLTHVTSGRRHGLNLSGDMASVKRRTHMHARTHADVRQRIHPPQCKPPHTDAGRCTTPKPHATHCNPLPRRPPPLPFQIII